MHRWRHSNNQRTTNGQVQTKHRSERRQNQFAASNVFTRASHTRLPLLARLALHCQKRLSANKSVPHCKRIVIEPRRYTTDICLHDTLPGTSFGLFTRWYNENICILLLLVSVLYPLRLVYVCGLCKHHCGRKFKDRLDFILIN